MQLAKIILPMFLVTSLFAVSGSTLYKQKCKSCHGSKADRKAMAYVVKMKKSFVKKYSKKELRDLAVYINKL